MDASGGDEYNKVIAEVPAMIDGLLKFAATRRADPADDLTSFLTQFEFEGERLDDNQPSTSSGISSAVASTPRPR